MILHSFIITLAVNVIGDVVLIPIYKNEGAALAFLLGCIAQAIFYLRKNTIAELKNVWLSIIVCTACAVGSGYLAKMLFPNNWLLLPTATLLYLVLLIVTAQVRLKDKRGFKLILQ